MRSLPAPGGVGDRGDAQLLLPLLLQGSFQLGFTDSAGSGAARAGLEPDHAGVGGQGKGSPWGEMSIKQVSSEAGDPGFCPLCPFAPQHPLSLSQHSLCLSLWPLIPALSITITIPPGPSTLCPHAPSSQHPLSLSIPVPAPSVPVPPCPSTLWPCPSTLCHCPCTLVSAPTVPVPAPSVLVPLIPALFVTVTLGLSTLCPHPSLSQHPLSLCSRSQHPLSLSIPVPAPSVPVPAPSVTVPTLCVPVPPVPAPRVPAGSPGGFQEQHRCRLPQPGPFPAGEVADPPASARSSLSRRPPQAEAQLGP